MPTQEEIDSKHEQLEMHRRTLSHLLKQRAKFSAGYAPAHIDNGINEARADIRSCKHTLRLWGEHVSDHPDDEEWTEPASAGVNTAFRTRPVWALHKGTALEDRPRYTPTSTFETFPFPWPPGSERADDPRVAAIAAAARDLVEKRDRWLNPEGAGDAELKKRTLTNLYNQRPTWLDLAHKKLDRAVLDAYSWPHDLSDEEILARLLALNLERAAGQGGVVASAPEDGGFVEGDAT